MKTCSRVFTLWVARQVPGQRLVGGDAGEAERERHRKKEREGIINYIIISSSCNNRIRVGVRLLIKVPPPIGR